MNPLIRILALVFGPLLAVASVGAGAQPSAPRVVLSTSEGDITLELNAAKAPKTVENFLAYVRSGHYDGTIFHRVIDGFMIQGGGFTPDMKQKPTKAPIALESRNGLKNERGTIAMARTSVPDSATSQFFINVVDNPRLDYPNPDGHGYAVFGRVVAGMDVVDRIRAVPTTSIAGHQNVPAKPVLIRSARIAP
jgi:peptidyl-prolyl cis-trans isomerase A (cyclophilin A)